MDEQTQDVRLERIYEQMFELSPEATLFLSLTGKVQMVNAKVTELTGYEPQEIVGKPVFELPFFLPETIDILKSKFKERISGKPIAPYDVPVRAKDGTVRVGQTMGKILKSPIGFPIGVMIVVHDVTAEREVGRSLEESKSFYQLLFENALNGIAYCKMLTDEQGKPVDFEYLEVNQAFDKIIGVKDVEGKKVTEVFPKIKEENPEIFEIYGRVASTGKSEHFDLNFRAVPMWLSISVYSPERGFFVAIFEDITERKRTELELKSRVELSEDMNKLIVGREIKMIELKEKIATLEKALKVKVEDDNEHE